MAYKLHIKCLEPFNTWELDRYVELKASKICSFMRAVAKEFSQCHLTLTSGSEKIAYAKWSTRRKVHDFGVEPAWQWLMQKEAQCGTSI